MEYITVEKEITKKQAIEYIRTTLFRFNYIFYYYNEHKELLAYNTKIARLSNEWDVQRFPLLLDQYIFTDEIEDLNINGCKDFLLKLKQLSEKFNLNISIPDDLKIIDIIPKFIRELKTNALRINKINLDEIEKVRGIYLKQSEDINLNRLNKTELEINIQKKHEYDELLRKHCDAYNQRQGIEMAEGRNPSFKGQWDTRKEELTNIIIETDAQMKQILQDYPLIKFLDGSTKPEKVQKQVNNLCDKIHNSLLKVDEKIVNDEYPIWEFTDLINYIFEKNNYKPVEKQEVIEQLNKWKSDKYKKDLFITIGSITLSIVAMFIPGGASLTALIARTLLQTGDVVLGAISAKEDIEDGILEIQKSYADIQLSPEQIDFIESSGVDKATQQFVIAFISAGFIIFDAKDVVKSGNLIKKCSELDDVTRSALKQSKRFGEKALQNCDIAALEKIGQGLPSSHATEIFNMKNTTDVVEALFKNNNTRVMTNLANLEEARQIPLALDFFPDNLNTNIIWLGMDNVEAKKVLQLRDSGEALSHYNKICTNPKTCLAFEDSSKIVENKVNRLFKKTEKITDNEKIVLLKETLPPDGKITQRTVYLRVETNNGYSTLANKSKDFAWVTDPYILAGKDMPADFMHSAGFTNDYMKSIGDEKVYFDVILFKDNVAAEKIIPNKVTDWNKINQDFLNKIDGQLEWMRTNTPDKYDDLSDTIGVLINKDGSFNKSLFESKYFDYFSKEHIPGTPYEKGEKSILGDLIEKCTGASNLYGGTGVTISENGIENVERAFNNFDNFQIKQMTHDEKSMKIFRFEVVKDMTVRSGNSIKIENVKIGVN